MIPPQRGFDDRSGGLRSGYRNADLEKLCQEKDVAFR
jgi:hypothetical protein